VDKSYLGLISSPLGHILVRRMFVHGFSDSGGHGIGGDNKSGIDVMDVP
jgi:hypothetical protein